MGVKGEVAYPYLVHEVRNPGLKGWNFGLKVLYIGVAWVVFEGDANGGWDFSMYRFASSLYDIHLHTYMMSSLGFVFIYWKSSFSRF